MLRVEEIQNVPIGLPAVPEYPLGVMALAWSRDDYTVYGRGVGEDGHSSIFRGQLDLKDIKLTITDTILPYSPGMLTAEGNVVYGYEDPSVLFPEYNFMEQRREGVLCTEAYYVEGSTGRLATNLVYIRFDGSVKPVLTPADALFMLPSLFSDVDMVKEPSLISEDVLLVEVAAKIGGRRRSRIAVAWVGPGGEIGNVSPWLEPMANTWFDNHTSTASCAMDLVPGIKLLVFNGGQLVEVPDKIKGGTKWINRWSVGLMLLNDSGDKFWWSEKPLIVPPEGIEPGPHDQEIAFASDARWLEAASEKGGILQILYHANDRFPCLWEGYVKFD